MALLNGGGLVVIGKWVKEGRDDANRALLLLRGTDAMEDDGVIPRLRAVEEMADRNRRALAREAGSSKEKAD